ncbi:MAG: DeoR/GlpR family DNA-binding transcription regulator [Lachnospiraceae bacterium]
MEQYILQQGTVSLDDLTKYFKVSTNTIRRDVSELLERGRIQKVYGGVSALEDTRLLPMSVRSTIHESEKKAIGQMAAGTVNNGDTVFLDSGSTVLYSIPYLAKLEGITIVTHSLPAMYEASKYSTLKVISLGGLYNPSTSSYVGISTLDALSCICTDAVFIAATGVSLEKGLTNTTYFEADIKRNVVKSSKKIILVADHTKFDHNSTISFFNFQDLHTVVTDECPSAKYLDTIQSNNINLLCR